MARVVTFGRMPTEAPQGNFRRIVFPELARLDQGTREGFISRVLSSDGASSRDLSRTISFQYADAPGHDFAVPVGSLHEITVDGETGVLSGQGWLADTPDGRLAELAIVSEALRHNSIDIGDVPPGGIELVEHGDFWSPDFWMEVRFNDWNLAKTTLVATPAFANAHAVLSDEITAALGLDDPLIVTCPNVLSAHTAIEIVASMETLAPFEYFHTPEADIPHKIMVDEPDEHGWVHIYGHLARWGQPHTGIHGENVYAPRSRDGYARFCQPSVLTEKGLVNTGPMTLLGGHISLRDACNDPQYAWADVRVVDGRHGPWISGVARPHVAHDMAVRYVARASRISGHWEDRNGGPLRMIVCCTTEGFPIDSPWPDGLAASFEVESPSMRLAIPTELFSFTELSGDAQQRILEWAQSSRTGASGSSTFSFASPTFPDAPSVEATDDDPTVDPEDEFDVDAAADERERELALEDEADALA